jgi:hypothetical protein
MNIDRITTGIEVIGFALLALGIGMVTSVVIGGLLGVALGLCAVGVALLAESLALQLISATPGKVKR